MDAIFNKATKIVDEYRNRERRKFNVVIYNASESEAEDSSKRNDEDDVSFVNAMTEEVGTCLGEIVQVGRLGQKSSDKKRPLKVQFMYIDHRRLLLRSIKKSHKTTQYNNVNVNPDLPYQERQFQKV